MDIRQAVVLARGLGTRMQARDEEVRLKPEAEAAAAQGVKALVPINDRPFLDYLYSRLREAGLLRVILVVAPEAEALRSHGRHISDRVRDMDVQFAVQEAPLGTANAVLAAEPETADEPFLVLNGDNLYPTQVLAEMRHGTGAGIAIFSRDELVEKSNIQRERIEKFGIVVPTPDWMLSRIVEKPPEPEKYRVDGRLWLNMNLLRLPPDFYDACRSIEPDPQRGEYEVTTALQYYKDGMGHAIETVRGSGAVYDLTARRDVPLLEEKLKGFDFVI